MNHPTGKSRGFLLSCMAMASVLMLAVSCNPKPESLVEEPEPLKLVGGFGFTEGPVVDGEGRFHFTDIPGNKVYRWTRAEGLAMLRDSTGWGNGMCFDAEGNLILCEMTNRRLTRMNRKGKVEVLTDQYRGSRYHSPNDVWVHPAGWIYFTDPAYFLDESEMEMPVEAVYRVDPQSKVVTRVTDHLVRPNGIIGTPDGKVLYVVSDTIHKTWRFRVEKDGSLSAKELFAANGHDGITLDELGNLYVSNRDSLSIDIYDPAGKYLETIRFPERPANVCFGGEEGKTLFVTAQTSVYTVKMKVRGSGLN